MSVQVRQNLIRNDVQPLMASQATDHFVRVTGLEAEQGYVRGQLHGASTGRDDQARACYEVPQAWPEVGALDIALKQQWIPTGQINGIVFIKVNRFCVAIHGAVFKTIHAQGAKG